MSARTAEATCTLSDSPASVSHVPLGLPPMLNPVLLATDEHAHSGALLSSSAVLHRRNTFTAAHSVSFGLGQSQTAATPLLYAPSPLPMPKNSLHALAQSCCAAGTAANGHATESVLQHEIRRICADRMAAGHGPAADVEISPIQATMGAHFATAVPHAAVPPLPGPMAPAGWGEAAAAAARTATPPQWPPSAVCASAAQSFQRAGSGRVKELVVLQHREHLARSPGRSTPARSPNQRATVAAEASCNTNDDGFLHAAGSRTGTTVAGGGGVHNLVSTVTSCTTATIHSPGATTASPHSPGGLAFRSAAAVEEANVDPAWCSSSTEGSDE